MYACNKKISLTDILSLQIFYNYVSDPRNRIDWCENMFEKINSCLEFLNRSLITSCWKWTSRRGKRSVIKHQNLILCCIELNVKYLPSSIYRHCNLIQPAITYNIQLILPLITNNTYNHEYDTFADSISENFLLLYPPVSNINVLIRRLLSHSSPCTKN